MSICSCDRRHKRVLIPNNLSFHVCPPGTEILTTQRKLPWPGSLQWRSTSSRATLLPGKTARRLFPSDSTLSSWRSGVASMVVFFGISANSASYWRFTLQNQTCSFFIFACCKKWLEGKIAGLGLSGIKSHKCKTAVALFKLLQESCNLSTLGSKTL